MEKDRVILTMFRDDVRRMIENAEDKKLDNVLTFFKSANVYSGAADSPIVHVVFPRLEWNLHNPLVRFVEGFVNGNVPYTFMSRIPTVAKRGRRTVCEMSDTWRFSILWNLSKVSFITARHILCGRFEKCVSQN